MFLSRHTQQGWVRRRGPAPLIIILIIVVLNVSTAFTLHQSALGGNSQPSKAFSNGHQSGFQGSRQTPYLNPTLPRKTKKSSLFQSSKCAEVQPYSSGRWREAAHENLVNLQRMAAKNGQMIPSLLSASTSSTISTLKRCWWCLPMMLALIPPYFVLFQNTLPSMPSWWSLVKLDAVFHSPYAAVILGVFLLSNIAYFISGTYLYLRYHLLVPSETSEVAPTFRDPLLGGSVLTAGTVSTVFHSVQALGSQSLAECLCFIDHGVAISSVLYFWFRCGRPSRNALLLSLAGFATLSITEGYAWLHSVWHLLSASAAVVWARDGLDSQLQQTSKV